MQQIVLDAAAGQLSAELTRRGIAADTQVHVVVDAFDGSGELLMAAIAQAGGAFAWLDDEAELYSDADLVDSAALSLRSGLLS